MALVSFQFLNYNLVSSDCEVAGNPFEDSYVCIIDDYAKTIGSVLNTIDEKDKTHLDLDPGKPAGLRDCSCRVVSANRRRFLLLWKIRQQLKFRIRKRKRPHDGLHAQ